MTLAEEFDIRRLDPILADAGSRKLKRVDDEGLSDTALVFREISRLGQATTRLIATSAGLSSYVTSQRLGSLRRQGCVELVSRGRGANVWRAVAGASLQPSIDEVREQRLSAVFAHIRQSAEPVSRRDAAIATGLTKDMADKLFNLLIEQKKITEADSISRAGKRVVRYSAVRGLEVEQ